MRSAMSRTNTLEQYSAHIASLGLDRATQANRLFAVTRAWLYAPYLPQPDRLARPSWEGGESRKRVLGEANWSAENRTPPIHPQTMSALLVWSMRFVNDFSDDIIVAKMIKSIPGDPGPELSALPPYQRFLRYLDDCRQTTGTIPGHVPSRGDSGRCIASAYIGWKLGLTERYGRSMALSHRVPDLEPSEEADLPLTIAGTIDGRPWTESINYYDVDHLCRLLATACFVVVAYLTGMRTEECRALEQGCCRTSSNPRSGQTRHFIVGRTFKAALDAEGNTIPEGAQREQPWQAIAPVAQAVKVMEKLHPDGQLLFPATAFAAQTLTSGSANAVTANVIRDRIQELIDWCNQQAERLGRVHEGIPEDCEGPVIPRRFRRTLAWFVYRKPGGRIALGVQYGHLRGHTTDGYGSRVSSGLRDVFPMEEALAASEFLTASHTRLRDGEHVTGPAAKRYTEGIQLYHNMFGGRHLTGRQAAALTRKPQTAHLRQRRPVHHLLLRPAQGPVPPATPNRRRCRTNTRHHQLPVQLRQRCSHRHQYRSRGSDSRAASIRDRLCHNAVAAARTPRTACVRTSSDHRRTSTKGGWTVTGTFDAAQERRAIREAMDRLIDGKTLYSDGKLTIKSLAEEAGVKRWLLTHRHTDLQDEFRVRIANTDVEPPVIRVLQEEKVAATKKVKELTADVTALTATIHQLERIIQVLALENQNLGAARAVQGKVVPLNSRGAPG